MANAFDNQKIQAIKRAKIVKYDNQHYVNI